MKKCLTIICFTLMISPLLAQRKPAYELYKANGKKVNFGKMIRQLSRGDIVLFGELHNDPIAHWLQLESSKALSQHRKLILGAEMIESDNQQALNAYLAGEIDQKGLDSLARLWPNYRTDYAPLVDFAKNNSLPFIATNIPRRYASDVHKKGGFQVLDSLPDQEKKWIAPLPIEFDPALPGYKNMLTMMGTHGSEDMVKAQAIKDATMAYFIHKNFREDALFLHFNGAYHSNHYEGILWYLEKANPNLTYFTISTVVQSDISSLEKENKGLADFIICVDEEMTKTY